MALLQSQYSVVGVSLCFAVHLKIFSNVFGCDFYNKCLLHLRIFMRYERCEKQQTVKKYFKIEYI